MDAELKDYLQSMEVRLLQSMEERLLQSMEERLLQSMEERLLQSMEERLGSRTAAMIQASEDRTATLIAAEIGNLHTQMQQGFARVDARFDSVDARLKLQAGLIQSGARAMARFSHFAENSEERWVDLADRVQALEHRLDNGKQR